MDSSSGTASPLSKPSLTALLKAALSERALPSDVDALLSELANPMAEGQSKQARAAFLRSVLKASRARHVKGSTGQTVHAAAVQALRNLGPPYSEKLPSQRALRVPIAGILLALIATVGPSIISLPEAFKALERGDPEVLLVMALAVSASGAAILGGWRGMRWLQLAGVGVMSLASLGCLLLALWVFVSGLSTYTFFMVVGLVSLGLSLVTGLSAWLLAPRWRDDEDASVGR
jgi:hypothetical protein